MKPYYEQDGIAIYHGDCLDVLPAIGRTANLVLIDPPFFMPAQQYAGRTGWQRSWADTSILATWWRTVVETLAARLATDGHFLTFCDDESYAVFFPVLYARFCNIGSLVWDKKSPGWVRRGVMPMNWSSRHAGPMPTGMAGRAETC